MAQELFERIVCGVDESPESLEAVRQAETLRAPEGTLALVGAAEVALAVHGGWDAPRIEHAIEESAAAALARAREAAGAAHLELVRGEPGATLLAAAERERATLVVVGTRGHGRASGVAFGRVSTRMVHEAPCSVLVARPASDAGWFPTAVVVGSDGSEHGEAARGVAAAIAARFGSELREILASPDPVEELVAASRHADLLVVGSRGLRGARSLGSVSERVAHRAACSVLVVRS